jgi:hypothetical protein
MAGQRQQTGGRRESSSSENGNGNGDGGQGGSPPEQVVRLGNLKAAVWVNTSGQGQQQRTYRSVSVSRRFQQNGEWKEQKLTLYPNDLPVLGDVIKEVLRRLLAMQDGGGEEAPF